jgi:hypothetical protein
MTRALFDNAEKKLPGLGNAYREPFKLQGATLPERADVRATLAKDVKDWHTGEITEDELYRAVRGSSYVLTGPELAAVARRIVELLEDRP